MYEMQNARETERLDPLKNSIGAEYTVEFQDGSEKSPDRNGSRDEFCKCCRNFCCGMVTIIVSCLLVLLAYKLYLNGMIWAGENSQENYKKGFRLASYYSSNMVLQRPPVKPRIWGYAADTGDIIVVNLNSGEQITTVFALKDSEDIVTWQAILDPINSTGPHTITVTCNDRDSDVIVLENVLIGDLWLCMGQSNMQHPMENLDNPYPDILDAVNYPEIRTFITGREWSKNPVQDLIRVERNWENPTKENIAPFSAICWLFGKHLYEKYKRPIGLIQAAWSSTRIETWSSPEALQKCFTVIKRADPPNTQSVIYNAMVHPFHSIPIYGAIWYQGEDNRDNAGNYGCALKAMVEDWREKWREKSPEMNHQFPFGVVQLAPWREREIASGFPSLRWQQTDKFGFLPNLNMPNFFMAVSIDLPDFYSPYSSIHPRYKRPIASRLALAAHVVAYNSTDEGLYQGPLPNHFKLENYSTVVLSYGVPIRHHTEKLGFEMCCGKTSMTTCSGGGNWKPAEMLERAELHVVLKIPCGTERVVTGIRYLWRESPCRLEQCPIYSVENNLPAPPFTSDGEITSNGRYLESNAI